MRTYPALDITWPSPNTDEQTDLVLAAIDDDAPIAVEPVGDGVRVFFSTPLARERAASKIATADPAAACLPVDVPDEGWAERSQAALDPVIVGTLMVASPDADTRGFTGPVIRIQPSMGFGTGHHASTRLMLELLQRQRVTGRSVLDVGTGSGVLALAARVLGATTVVAIDVDPDALASARVNFTLNREGQIELLEADIAGAPRRLARTFDVVLANLTGAMISRYAGELTRLAGRGGCVTVCGFQRDDAPAVAAALEAAGWTAGERAEEDGWVAMATIPTPSTTR